MSRRAEGERRPDVPAARGVARNRKGEAMHNTYMTERLQGWGYDGDVESIGNVAHVKLAGRSNNRKAANAVATLFKALTNGKTSIWETRGEFVVRVRGAAAAVGA